MRSRINCKVFSSIQKKQITSGFACLCAVQKNDHIGARFGHVTAKIPKFLVVFKKIRLKLRLPLVLLSEFSLYFLSSTPLFNSFALLFSSELNTNYFSFRPKFRQYSLKPVRLPSTELVWRLLPSFRLLNFSRCPFFEDKFSLIRQLQSFHSNGTWFGMWHFSHFSWIWITSKETNRLTELYRLYRSNATGWIQNCEQDIHTTYEKNSNQQMRVYFPWQTKKNAMKKNSIWLGTLVFLGACGIFS